RDSTPLHDDPQSVVAGDRQAIRAGAAGRSFAVLATSVSDRPRTGTRRVCLSCGCHHSFARNARKPPKPYRIVRSDGQTRLRFEVSTRWPQRSVTLVDGPKPSRVCSPGLGDCDEDRSPDGVLTGLAKHRPKLTDVGCARVASDAPSCELAH